MDIKWIKINTDIFDDEKFQIIDGMPEADSIELIWFKLLVFAGRSNNGGIFFFNDRVAYNEEMLAAIFHRPLALVRLAINTFINLGMVEEIDGVYAITNWDKHQQQLDAYEKKKQRDREYSRVYREKHQQLIEEKKKSSDESSDVSRYCSYSYSNNNIYNNNIIKEEEINKEEEKPDLEEWFDAYLKIYPKKTKYKQGLHSYFDFFVNHPISQWKEIAKDLFNALNLYIEDYTKAHPDDKKFQYIPTLENWLKDEAMYWIKQVEVTDGNDK